MALSVLDLDGGMSMTSDTHEHTLNVALGEVLEVWPETPILPKPALS